MNSKLTCRLGDFDFDDNAILGFSASTNDQTGTTYTVAVSDNGKVEGKTRRYAKEQPACRADRAVVSGRLIAAPVPRGGRIPSRLIACPTGPPRRLDLRP